MPRTPVASEWMSFNLVLVGKWVTWAIGRANIWLCVQHCGQLKSGVLEMNLLSSGRRIEDAHLSTSVLGRCRDGCGKLSACT